MGVSPVRLPVAATREFALTTATWLSPRRTRRRLGEQNLEPSLTTRGGKGWSLRLRRGEAKAGAFAYGEICDIFWKIPNGSALPLR
jgi:hypothetical protein